MANNHIEGIISSEANVTESDTMAIGLNWRVAKNGRLRAMFKKVANPGSHKCPCGKVLSANKAWDHVQQCEVAQAEFKAAQERVRQAVKEQQDAAKAAKEAAENDEQGTAGEDTKPEDTDQGASSGVRDAGSQEDQQPDSV